MDGELKRPASEGATKEWDRRSKDGFFLLSQCLSSNQLHHVKHLIKDIQCGPKAWKILKDVHAPSSEAMVVVLERQLHAVKINEGCAVQGAFDQLRDLYVKLSAAGVDYPEKIKCYKALSLLPESWGPLVVNLNCMKDSWSLEWIRARVLQEEFRRKELTATAGEGGGSAYGMKGFKGRGSKKGKAKEGSGGEQYSGGKRSNKGGKRCGGKCCAREASERQQTGGQVGTEEIRAGPRMKLMDAPGKQSDWQQPNRLVELFGGIGARLAAVVKNGIAVQQWIYVEQALEVRKMAKHHAWRLQAEFPELLSAEVIRDAMGRSLHDVSQVTEAQVASWGQVDLLVAGWECQGVSWAGKGKGGEDLRTKLIESLFRILEWLQERQGRVAYLLENLDLEGDCREPIQLVRERISRQLGKGISCDAARAGSYAHRLRMYWQNVVPVLRLQEEVEGVKRATGRRVLDILEPGRTPAPVCQKGYSKHYPCNQVGRDMRALPTLVSYVGAASYKWERVRPGTGLVYGHRQGRWEEPTALERELAMGYGENVTANLGVSEEERRRVVGNAMDGYMMRCLVQRMRRETVLS
ncbi:unnamed protein product [Closterium sp. NIES-54]